MRQPQWSETDLIELHGLFLKRCGSPSASEVHALADRILQHPACEVRLWTACGGSSNQRRRRPGADVEDEDVVQQACLLLFRSLATRRLRYQDRGHAAFGRWFWMLCCHVAAEARKAFRRRQCPPVEFVDPEILCCVCDRSPDADLPEESDWAEKERERVLKAIDKLPQVQQDALFDCAAGLTIAQCALKRSTSEATISRQRRKARRALLKLLDEQP
jgi:RNA polymerase sigma factor (sigma-70 family)